MDECRRCLLTAAMTATVMGVLVGAVTVPVVGCVVDTVDGSPPPG